MSGIGLFWTTGPFFRNGELQTAAKLYAYEPGTTTKRPMYTDRLLNITANNPLTSDQNGVLSAYFDGLYKLIVKSSDDTAILLEATEASFFHALSLHGEGEQLRIGPQGELTDAEDNVDRRIRMVGHWGDPSSPGGRSEGDRIIIFETAIQKVAIGHDAQNGIWVQSHNSDQIFPAFSVWTGVNSTPPTAKFQVLGNGRVKVANGGKVHIPVIATASLPAAAAAEDGSIVIEDNGTGDRNLIIYAGGQRFRIDGGAAF